MKPVVVLEVGTSCHVKCRFCYKEYDKTRKDFFKDLSQIEDELAQISKISDCILLTGGETTLYPYLIELLNICKQYNLKVRFITLGDRFSDKVFLDKILKIGVINIIQISIHTIFREEELIMYGKNGIINKQLKGLKNLINTDVNYGVNIVLNRYNINSIGKTIKGLYYNYQVKSFFITAMHIFSGITKTNVVSSIEYVKIIKQLDVIKDLINNGNVNLALKSFPLCIHKLFSKYKYKIKELDLKDSFKTNTQEKTDWDFKKQHQIELQKCKNCYVYGKKCFGPYNYYIKLYGESEFSPISKLEYKKLLDKKYISK